MSAQPQFFHHVELQSQSARLLATTLSAMLSMPVVGALRTARGTSYCLQSQQAMIICTAPSVSLRDSEPQDTVFDHFHDGLARSDLLHVRAIGLHVHDIDTADMRLRSLLLEDQNETIGERRHDMMEVRMPAMLKQIGLRFLSSELAPGPGLLSGVQNGLAGFSRGKDASTSGPAAPGGIVSIDHIAINVNDARTVSERIKEVLEWHFFREFKEDILQRPLSALTLSSDTAEGLLTFVQPTRKKSVFADTLTANGGACVHHIALNCENILQFADHMAGRGLWETMPAPDENYYRELKPIALAFLDEDEFEKLQRYGMLLDAGEDCALIQVFLPYLNDMPGIFIELIGRIPRRGSVTSQATAPGCGGFGDHNVTHLYDCMVKAVTQDPFSP
jgi:4-hydroxyphenylpyruvate dioxygenase